jgi:hypothetical protein
VAQQCTISNAQSSPCSLSHASIRGIAEDKSGEGIMALLERGASDDCGKHLMSKVIASILC